MERTESQNPLPANDCLEEDETEFRSSSELNSSIELTVPAEPAGGRVDAYIAGRTGLTRSAIQRLLGEGNINVNGRSAKPSQTVRAGDEIFISLPPPARTELVPENIPIDIVYQDADIAVVNKPVGMVVHPAAGNPSGTLVNALMYHIKDLSGIGGELRPGIVHRIDKDTSGLLVIAKNDAAHAFLSNELKLHAVSRVYTALCEGNFRDDSGIVSAPIGRHRLDRKRMAVTPDGREAVTHYWVMERFGDKTLLRVELETGRTHQIRVHMAYIGHPLVGDGLYSSGRNSLGFHGQALHAGELRLRHPATLEPIRFEAGLPEQFKNALAKLRASQSR